MSKSAFFATAYAVDKESWDYFSEDVDFMEHIKNHLGHQLAERIFQECQSGEKIVTVGNTYEKEIHELNQVEIREKVSLEDLVRCKDCKAMQIYGGYEDENDFNTWWCEELEREIIDPLWFCKYGERRSE